MLTVGLTGGIGSGKSTVAKMFMEFGVPVYFADERVKQLQNSEPLRSEIVKHFGNHVYENGLLQRARMADIVFSDPNKLSLLNSLVHPAVGQDYQTWLKAQDSPYIIKEAAIIFEIGAQNSYDQIILVTAPREERKKRVALRDGTSEAQIEARMNKQWPDEKKIPLSDFVIENNDLESTQRQVSLLHKTLISRASGV